MTPTAASSFKRTNFPTTPRTTEFSQIKGNRFALKLGGMNLGVVQKRDGFFCAEFLWGDQIVPHAPHTKVKRDEAGNVTEVVPLPMGPFLKTVRDAVIARFFPAPQA